MKDGKIKLEKGCTQNYFNPIKVLLEIYICYYKNLNRFLISTSKMDSIIDLKNIVEDLDVEDKERFNRIYNFTTSIGFEEIPESFVDKQLRWFGRKNESVENTLERVKNQKVVRIYNKCTIEIFHPFTDRKDSEAPVLH